MTSAVSHAARHRQAEPSRALLAFQRGVTECASLRLSTHWSQDRAVSTLKRETIPELQGPVVDGCVVGYLHPEREFNPGRP